MDQLTLDFDQPILAPTIEPKPIGTIEPERICGLVAFPLSRHLFVRQIAARMRTIRDDAKRETDLTNCLRRFFRSRRDDGLDFLKAEADVRDFERAIRAEYRRPTPPPPRWRDHDALIPFRSFEEKVRVRQTA